MERIPSFNLCCIDYRYDALATQYFKDTENEFNYFLNTTAGSALCLGYKEYCIKNCFHPNKHNIKYDSCKCNNKTKEDQIIQSCNPENKDMKLLKDSVKKNLEISISLKQVTEVYLLNHQDCGAIKAYLSCSGYPNYLGENNAKEIEINTFLLNYASEYIYKKFPHIQNIKLGLIDINGTVANFIDNEWIITYIGIGINPLGLWYGLV